MQADIIIKNGRVIDPKNHVDRVGDIAIQGKKLIPAQPEMTAKTVIDAAGCIVTPGLIDSHAHIFERGTDSGINPDLSMLPLGVTTVADAGSAGVSTYRSFLDRLALCRIKTKFYLHISPTGQVTHQYPESIRPDKWNMEKFEEAVDTCGDKLLGFKLRVSRNVVGEDCLYDLEQALNLGERFHKRIVVHVTDPAVSQAKIASLLRPGDIFCHVFHGRGYTILENDKVLKEIWDARERGVIFDCCHGSINFNFAVAEKALACGFLPDVLTSDMNAVTWNRSPLFNLPVVMSKFLLMGLDIPEIIALVTSNAAKVIGEEGALGTLEKGTCADVAILKAEDKRTRFVDAEGQTREGKRLFRVMASILDGTIVFRTQDICE